MDVFPDEAEPLSHKFERGLSIEKLPWSEKYRPKSLVEFESHQFISESLNKMLANKNIPHLLFYGPPGTGKTSAILAITRQVYDDAQRKFMVLEMNASDDRGINTVRNEILNFASSKSLFSSNHKLVILDEADSMTHDAQNALRRVIEKYTKNVRFCLLCNYLSGIIPAIQSRCMRFRFFPLPEKIMKNRLKTVVKLESVTYEESGLDSIVRASSGDMRKALNTAQTTYMSQGVINDDTVRKTTGYPSLKDISNLIDILLNSDVKTCYDHVMKISIHQGLTLSDIIKELSLELSNSNIPEMVLAVLIDDLSTIEYNYTCGTNVKTHVAGLVSCFYCARVQIQLMSQTQS